MKTLKFFIFSILAVLIFFTMGHTACTEEEKDAARTREVGNALIKN